MKRIFALLLVCAALLSGCGGAPASGRPADSSSLPASQPGSQLAPPPPQDPIVEAAPQTQAWPLTGLALPEGTAQAGRPVAVLVDNTRQAYPQWGVAAADAVVEALTEGGITRLMCLYSTPDPIVKVGPVRSVRDGFLQLAMPLNAVPVHIGASSFGYNFLNFYQWNTIDAMNVGVNVFDFDKDRNFQRDANGRRIAPEHCWYTHGAAITNGMQLRGIAPEGGMTPLFAFAEGASAVGADALSVQLQYSYYAQSGFTYDAASGKYLKTSFDGLPHTDANDGAQLAFDNVVLLRCATFEKPDGVHSDFNFSGANGWWLCGGKLQPITWKKGEPEAPLTLYDENGNALTVRSGKSYVGFFSGAAGESLSADGQPLLDGSPVVPFAPSPTAAPSSEAGQP